MSARIKELEKALSDSQAGKPTSHPLLRDAGRPDPFEDINDLEAKYEANVDSISAAIGTLSIGQDGRAKYYGNTASSEVRHRSPCF